LSSTAALLTFTFAGAILTITPGPDTLLVVRTAVAEGASRAVFAGIGICCGLLVWGLLVALGLGALLVASRPAYTLLQWAGAAYLFWLGCNLLIRPRKEMAQFAAAGSNLESRRSFFVGLRTNLMNPKVGAFYVTLLPQFVPADVAVTPFVAALVAIHASEGALWFALLIFLTRPLSQLIARPAMRRSIDHVTGVIFIAFGLRLVLSERWR